MEFFLICSAFIYIRKRSALAYADADADHTIIYYESIESLYIDMFKIYILLRITL